MLFTDTNVFEAGHKPEPNVKYLQHSKQKGSIHLHHDRSTSLLKLNQAVSRRKKYLARRSKGDYCSSSGSDDDSDDDDAFDDKGSRPCAVKLPLWTCRMTCPHFTGSQELSERVKRGYRGSSLQLSDLRTGGCSTERGDVYLCLASTVATTVSRLKFSSSTARSLRL